jgi:methanogenic corrinoid protein MtbC1
MPDLCHSMKWVAQCTGLSPHVIRVWERRYNAVEPRRTNTNRRLFSDADVGRLTLLCAATKNGHSIGRIARLPEDKLRVLAGQSERGTASPDAANAGSNGGGADGSLSAAFCAIRALDAHRLEQFLRNAELGLGGHGLLEKVIAPLVQKLGDLWHSGEITAAQEHFASGILRNHLGALGRAYALTTQAPLLVVATPTGQLHELGALMAAAAAANYGWRVVCLGASLPAIEIAGSAARCEARAVALSIVYPADDPQLPAELESLRRHLPPSIPLIVGGRAAGAYQAVLDRIGAMGVPTLRGLYEALDRVRQSRVPAAATPAVARR